MYKFVYKLYAYRILTVTKMNNIKCISCKQTIENCECHIDNKDKHRGLIQLIKEIIKNERDKPETKRVK